MVCILAAVCHTYCAYSSFNCKCYLYFCGVRIIVGIFNIAIYFTQKYLFGIMQLVVMLLSIYPFGY